MIYPVPLHLFLLKQVEVGVANIAQLAERQIVALDAVGSNPAIRPKSLKIMGKS